MFGKAGHALEPQVNEIALPHWIEGLRRQLGQMIRIFFMYYLPVIFLLVLLGVQKSVPPDMVLRDPAAIANEPFYLGVVSNIGLLLWASSVCACLLAYAVITRDGGDREWRAFFLASAGFTSILMVDDMLMLHESVLLDLFGLPETLAFGTYAILGVAFLVGFRSTIIKTEYILLLASLSFFALSIFIDIDNNPIMIPINNMHPIMQTSLVEDGVKFLGIFGWLIYFIRTTMSHLGSITLVRSCDRPTR